MRKLLLLAPVLLLASCHSEQVVLRTQATASEPIVSAAPAVAPDSTLTATVVATLPAAPAPVAAFAVPATPQRQPARQLQRVGTLRPLAQLAAARLPMLTTKRLAHRLQRQRPTEGTAENGLGRIALFFIGVVLAVLAGLAALVNVIFGVGFFTALGYTAAGLVVLALLYVLLSGGKKKTTVKTTTK